MHMKKRLFLSGIVFPLLLPLYASAADPIRNIDTRFENDRYYITYDADIPRNYYLNDVSLWIVAGDGERPVEGRLTGGIGKVYAAGQKTIVWIPGPGELPANPYNLFFRVSGSLEPRPGREGLDLVHAYFEYIYSPSAPMGMGFGVGEGRWGGYVRIRFDTESGAYDQRKSLVTFSVGPCFYVSDRLRLHVGVGYGELDWNEAGFEYREIPCFGYEAGGTFLFLKNRLLGIHAGYSGFLHSRQGESLLRHFGEFTFGVSFNGNW